VKIIVVANMVVIAYY